MDSIATQKKHSLLSDDKTQYLYLTTITNSQLFHYLRILNFCATIHSINLKEGISMSIISDYYPLSQHLNKLVEKGVTEATLDVLKRDLPPTARKNPTWWSNSRTEKYRQCASWLDYGWEKKKVDLEGEKVVFNYMVK